MLKRALGLDAASTEWQQSDPWVKLGLRSAIFMFGGLVLVCLVFSISGAVVATGTVTVEGNYKTIQHLDGGIVSKILVRNGDVVKKGQELARLEDTSAQANMAIVQGRRRDFSIQQGRLIAERDRRPALDLPDAVKPFAADPQVKEIMATQKALFDARRASHQGELSVLRQRIEQVHAEMRGQEVELKSRKRQLELANKELGDIEPLFAKGFANQQRLGGLQREQARLEGDVGRISADLARSRGAIAEAELKLAQSEKEFTQSVVDELRKVQAQLSEVEEQAKTLRDKLDRVVIRAPESGRVHALAVHTEGGVIQPGTALMTIVPDGERLVVEAQVQPQDVDKVRQGLAAAVRFPAFDAKSTPRIAGTVSTVSAAELTTSQGKTYFTARIEISPEEMSRIGASHRLVPGMPAEVFIETASRSILSYFIKPLVDAMARTMRD
jgi:HlyD family type I secretion membrane fusion protein